jgi:DNA-binding CsgD family transcriptional regulator
VPLESARELHDPTQDPTEEVARRQRRRALERAIGALSARHRQAIGYALSGLTPEEVGRRLGIGRNAADALLHRARRSLRAHLSAVRDGMWSLAVGARLGWTRLTRRSAVDPGLAEASAVTLAHSVVGLAAAALVASLAFPASPPPPRPPVRVSTEQPVSALEGAAVPASPAPPPPAPAPRPGRPAPRTLRVGRAFTASWGEDGFHGRARVPGPGKERDWDLLGIGFGLEDRPGGGALEGELETLVRRACGRHPVLCESPLELVR